MRRETGLWLVGLFWVLACGSEKSDDTSTSAAGTDGTSTGGSETATDGATSTSGASAGGSGTAGASGAPTAGTGGGSGGGGCETPDDCKLLSDCCTCNAINASEDPPVCDEECDGFTKCEVFGVQAATCRDGACVIEPRNCDGTTVECMAAPPDCSDGYFPVVDQDGTCWTGECVYAAYCA